MANPFTSNTDNQFLLRRNYKLFNKNHAPNRQINKPSINFQKIQHIKANNPFKSISPNPTIRYHTSHQHSKTYLSKDTKHNKNTDSKFLLGKSRINKVQENKWKQQLYKYEKQKFNTYGVDGLRYQAFRSQTVIPSDVKNDYFGYDHALLTKEVVSAKYLYEKQSNTYKNSTYHTNSQSKHTQPVKFQQRQIFHDDQNDSDVQQVKISLKNSKKQNQRETLRNSYVKDMFDSQFENLQRNKNLYDSNGQDSSYPQRYSLNRDSFSNQPPKEIGTFNIETKKTQSNRKQYPKLLEMRGKVYYQIPI